MKPKPKLWLIESDKATIGLFNRHLATNYVFDVFSNLAKFKKRLNDCSLAKNDHLPDLIISELDFTDGCILDFWDTEKSKYQLPPFIIVSKAQSAARIDACYQAGALDFFGKPIRWIEFLAKLKRHCIITNNTSKFHFSDEQLSILTLKEYRILKLLNSSPNAELSKSEIIDSVWGEIAISKKTFDVHLFHLRKKLWDFGMEISFTPPTRYRLSKRR